MKIQKAIIQHRKGKCKYFDDMIVDIEVNKELNPISAEFLMRGRNLNISIVFVS